MRNRGIALRLRRDGKQWVQTIKDQGRISAGLFQHRESEVFVRNGHPDYSIITDPGLRRIFSNPAIAAQIKPIFSTQFSRNIQLIQLDDGTKIEFCLDRGTVLADQSHIPICELELELKSGKAKQLFLFALTLQKAFPFSLRLENSSKAERGYSLSSGFKKPPINAKRIPLNPKMCMKLTFKSIYWNCLEHLSSNEHGILNKRDIEYLDQMCIAIDRQRFALKIFLEILPKKTIKPMMRELKWLKTQFNLARDWGVFFFNILPEVGDYFPDDPVIDVLMRASKKRYIKHHNIVRKLLKSKRYLRLMLEIGVWLNEEVFLAKKKSFKKLSQANCTLKEFSGSLLCKQHQHLKKFKNTKTLCRLELHTLRAIVNKQCNTIAFFADLYPKSNVNPYLRSLYKLKHMLDVSISKTAIINQLNDENELNEIDRGINEAIGIIRDWNRCEEFRKEIMLGRVLTSFYTICPFWLKRSI